MPAELDPLIEAKLLEIADAKAAGEAQRRGERLTVNNDSVDEVEAARLACLEILTEFKDVIANERDLRYVAMRLAPKLSPEAAQAMRAIDYPTYARHRDGGPSPG